MNVQINDGGRAEYFKAKTVGDCVTRAIAIVTDKDYKEVYQTITKLVGYTPRNGVLKKDTKKVMKHFGGFWVPTMEIGKGCTTHLKDGEVPMEGRIICNLSGHVCAVIDGIINDTFDPSRKGTRCVYGYWVFKHYRTINKRKTMIKNEQERQRIGQRIAELRKAVEWTDELGIHRKGMTQQQLAERCEIRQSNLARIEGGKYATTIDILSSIAEVLGKKIDFI